MVWELLLAFVLCVALIVILWCLMGLFLLPVFSENMITLCFSENGGETLEQQARAYSWLRDGNRSGGLFVIVDCGLNRTGKCCADLLCRTYPWVRCCKEENILDYLMQLEDIV